MLRFTVIVLRIDWARLQDDTLFPEPEELVMRILKSSTQLEREG